MYRIGDQVRATRNLGGIIFTKVPSGTRGYVVTRIGIIFRRYQVVFENGVSFNVRESDLSSSRS